MRLTVTCNICDSVIVDLEDEHQITYAGKYPFWCGTCDDYAVLGKSPVTLTVTA